MKKKIGISIGIFLILLIIAGIITNYADSGRVTTGHEPKYCIKLVTNDGSKVTYWGLGYKVIRYTGVSPKEPYESNIGVKMGSWFMKYELPKSNVIEIEYEGQTITITDIKDLETINHIISNKLDNEQSKEEHFFFGKVVESTASYMIVEPNENEEIRKSADKISIGLGEYNDALYRVGTNVKITYNGEIMETYPAQVKGAKIEVKSAENFEILFKDRQPIDSYNKIYAILDKSETDQYDYSIYAYDGSVNIRIDGQDYSLKEALLENKITMEEIISKATQDEKDGKIKADMYNDGGSIEYHYENYTIIKCHTLDGNRDVYIGTKDLKLNNVI